MQVEYSFIEGIGLIFLILRFRLILPVSFALLLLLPLLLAGLEIGPDLRDHGE